MTPRLPGHFSIFGFVFVMLKSLPVIARQWSHEKFAILTLKPQTWAIPINKDSLTFASEKSRSFFR